MLKLFTYLFTIFGIWALKFLLPRMIRRLRGNKLPKGAIIGIGNRSIKNKQSPKNRVAQIAVSCGIGIQYVILLSFVYRLIFGFEEHNLFFMLELPMAVYWIGISGMWLLGVWVSLPPRKHTRLSVELLGWRLGSIDIPEHTPTHSRVQYSEGQLKQLIGTFVYSSCNSPDQFAH